jgi:spermidine synthase
MSTKRSHLSTARRVSTHATLAPHAPATRTSATLLPCALLFVSGTTALVYQLLWIKQLSLVVGVDVYAVTTAVSAFFAGLAIGGLLWGRRSDRHDRPLRLYAQLEIGVALLGAVATLALGVAARPFAQLEALFLPLAWLIPFALVGVPALLMGGTLPVLVRALGPAEDDIGANGGRMYAANTAGAIAGALLAPFVLIPMLGVRGSALAAAALNLLAAVVAFAVDQRVGGDGGPKPTLRSHEGVSPGAIAKVMTEDSSLGCTEQREAQHRVQVPAPTARRLARKDDALRAPQDARTAVWLYAVAGGIALGYEVVWSQAIVQFMSTRAFAFAIVLATYLAGLVLGSALAARRADRSREPWAVFGFLIAAAGLTALLEIALLGGWLFDLQSWSAAAMRGITDNALAAMCARFAAAALCIVFVPTLLLGAAFPFVLRLAVGAEAVGRDVGTVVALNTLGGIAGSLLVGFVLVPWLGLVHTLAALAVAAALLGVYATTRARGADHWRFATLGVGIIVLIAAAATPSDRLANLLAQVRSGTLRAYEESRGGTVAVIEQGSGRNTFRRLYIQGVSNSGDALTSLRYMRLQALLPLLIHRGEPKSALVIGLGTGITAGALLRYPGLDTRVIAELLPAVARAAPQFHGNYGVASDSRADIRLRDGRRELLRNEARYDLITLEPPPPSAAGVVNLYSTDFYRLASARLNRDGILAQWLPLPTQNDEDTRALVRSFLDAFPHASLWTTELHEMLLVGSAQPLELDAARIAARFAQPEVAESLREVGIGSPAALLATYVTDHAGLERYAGNAAPVTDDQPRIEYAAWTRTGEFPATLERLLALHSDPPLTEASEELRAAISSEREHLLRFYSAGLHAYRNERDAWSSDMQRVHAADPDNPYYNWFGG